MKKILLQDNFFAPRQKLNISSTIPSALKRCGETGRIDAFKLRWKPGCDLPLPHVYWDSDVAKVMEGMAYVAGESPEIAARLDELVDLVVSAQQPDGYLNTHYTVTEQDQRWKNLAHMHELYCAGHLTEAAVAHYEATGSRKFLDAMCRYCDYICEVFGEDGIPGYPGHQELELALVKLYRVTGDEKYLKQAELFIKRRGEKPNYFLEKEGVALELQEFCQSHIPFSEQKEASGHAVRILYMACGMADVAKETNDARMLAHCERLFDDLAENKIYITGGVGSQQIGEFVGGSGEQVAERSYAESCAAIALVLFSARMLKITGKAKYADILEKTIYNCAVSGLSLSGDRFFYSNLHACHRGMKPRGHVALERMPWYSVSCCPTSYCRFLPQIGNFCYRAEERSLAVDIPAAATVATDEYTVEIVSDYPWNGNVKINVLEGEVEELSVRIPGWCRESVLPPVGSVADGFWSLDRKAAAGESFEFEFAMPVEKVFTSIPSLSGQAALCRGPLVYCVEIPFGSEISPFEIRLDDQIEFQVTEVENLPVRCKSLTFEAWRCPAPEKLYSTSVSKPQQVVVEAVPYAFWQNREKSEMTIFMPFLP